MPKKKSGDHNGTEGSNIQSQIINTNYIVSPLQSFHCEHKDSLFWNVSYLTQRSYLSLFL